METKEYLSRTFIIPHLVVQIKLDDYIIVRSNLTQDILMN